MILSERTITFGTVQDPVLNFTILTQCYCKQYRADKDIRNFTNITKTLDYTFEESVILLTEQGTVHKVVEA